MYEKGACTPVYLYRQNIMVVAWLESSKARHFLIYVVIVAIRNGILQSQEIWRAKWHSKVVCQTVMSTAVKCYSRNSDHCFANFTIQLILFLYIVYCSLFLSSFFILHAIICSSVYSSTEHACLVCVYLYYWVYISPFLNLCSIHYHCFLDIKGYIQQSLSYVDYYKVLLCGN